jgi:uncharacterized damage-inducible protein DinB
MKKSRLLLPIAKQGVPMHTPDALLDLHERAHRNLTALLAHCRQLSGEEINRELTGFGYPTVRLQLHHGIGAEKYWIGVLQGRIDADDDSPDYPTVESLEVYREQVFAATEAYLRASSVDELNTARPIMTWGNRKQVLTRVHAHADAPLPPPGPNRRYVQAAGEAVHRVRLSDRLSRCVAVQSRSTL